MKELGDVEYLGMEKYRIIELSDYIEIPVGTRIKFEGVVADKPVMRAR